jgi:hypothetical protein
MSQLDDHRLIRIDQFSVSQEQSQGKRIIDGVYLELSNTLPSNDTVDTTWFVGRSYKLSVAELRQLHKEAVNMIATLERRLAEGYFSVSE